MTQAELTRRQVLAGASAAALACLGSGLPQARGAAAQAKAGADAAEAGGDDRPNVVLFLADDQGIEHVGCYGNAVVRTPQIDALAREGMRFTRAYTVTAMCAPSRSALYTGLFPHRNGAHPNHSKVRPGVRSLPHYLGPLGYRVGLAGKTHIGPDESFPFERMRLHAGDIGAFVNAGGPFCLVVASNEPHGPHEKETPYDPAKVPVYPHHVDTPEMRSLTAHYYADIDNLDAEVALVRKLLRQAGVEDRTAFIYTSDHGFNIFAKWSCYEAGLHVPFIVRWPGRVAAGSTADAMVSFVDVVPTLIELAGGTPPPDLDGRSFAGVLAGRTQKHRDLIFGAHTNLGIINGGPYPIRSVRDGRHKYIRNLMPEETMRCVVTHERDGSLKEAGIFASWREKAKADPRAAARVEQFLHRPAEELYDLEADPHELVNLADDPKLAEVRARLARELDAWMKQQGDPGAGAERRGKGTG